MDNVNVSAYTFTLFSELTERSIYRCIEVRENFLETSMGIASLHERRTMNEREERKTSVLVRHEGRERKEIAVIVARCPRLTRIERENESGRHVDVLLAISEMRRAVEEKSIDRSTSQPLRHFPTIARTNLLSFSVTSS